MMLKIPSLCSTLNRFSDLPLLLIRLSVGTLFFQTGMGKLTHLADTTAFFVSLHIPMPQFNALLSATTEVVGGSFLILGLMTRIVCIPLSFVMVVAILTAQLPTLSGLSDFIRLSEVDYLLFFLLFFCMGAGRMSVDYWLKRFFPYGR